MDTYHSGQGVPVYTEKVVSLDGPYTDAHDPVGDAWTSKFERSPETAKYQDKAFGIAFYLQLLVFGILFVVIKAHSDAPVYQGLVPSESREFVPLILKAFAASSASAVALGYVALLLLRAFPRFFIHATMILNLVFMVVMAFVFAFVLHAYWTLVIWLLLLALWAFVYWGMLPLIPFLAELLSTVCDLIMTYPSTIAVNIGSVVIQFGWIMLFSYVILDLQRKFSHGTVIGLTVWLLLSFYWTIQVIRNIAHTANCGVFASWYFMAGTLNMPRSPMVGSLKRAMTTSFGSVAFGSLIVAILQTLRTLLRSNTHQDNVLAIIGNCILGCIESIARYVNHYAFVYVATYGKNFIDSAKSVWDVFERTGLINLINDTILSKLQFGLCSAIAIILGLGAAGLTKIMGLTNEYIGLVVGCCFVGGWLVTSLIMQTLESGASTIYVCYAEDPQALARTKPALYDSLTSTFGGILVSNGGMGNMRV